MDAKDGVYAEFKIEDEGDIIRLKNLTKTYKPISQNDIAHLLKMLEKKGREHLVPFFKKHIMGIVDAKDLQVSTPQPKKKKKRKEIDECYQRVSRKASDFQFNGREIKVGRYILGTNLEFAISPRVLKKIKGDFNIRIYDNGNFDFETDELDRLLNLVEVYSYSFLDGKCKKFFNKKIDSIALYAEREFTLKYNDFGINEANGRYELKYNAVKYSLLNKDDMLWNFSRLLAAQKHIPQKYRDSYESKGILAYLVDKFNDEFRTCLTNLLRKDVYYTEKDCEVVAWNYETYRPSIYVYFRLVEYDKYPSITLPSFSFSRNISFRFFNLPSGEPYNFSNESIEAIDACMAKMLKSDDYYPLLNVNLQSIKERKNVERVFNRECWGAVSYDIEGKKHTVTSADCLLDISDEHYLIAHSRISKDYTQLLRSGRIDRIAYFRDRNRVHSNTSYWDNGVDCYLLANDEYIELNALDSSKSTYIFKVKKGCIDAAMFLIWSYFSSHIENKREYKHIGIEYLFSYFGIEWYNNTGSPITRGEDGLYQFDLPCIF